MLRRACRVAFVIIAVLAGLCAAAVVASWSWLRSDAGQRFAVERLRAPLRAAGIELDVDRVSGQLFSGVQLDGVTARSCAQHVTLKARRVDVEYGLLSLLRGAPELAVTVDEPVLAAAGDAPCRVDSGGDAPSLPRRIVVRRLAIHRGAVGSPDPRLAAIELVGDGVIERDAGGAPAITVHVAEASARIFAATSDSHLELSGDATPERIDVQLTATATRDDLARHAAGAAPAGPVALRARLFGPPAALQLDGQVKTALGDGELSGTVDAPHRRAELTLATQRVVIAPAGSDVEVTASADVRLGAVAADGRPPRITLRGHGDYRRRGFDPSLEGAAMRRHAEELPGGSWSGRATTTIQRDGLATRFHIELSSDGKRGPEPAGVVLSGTFVVPRAGPPRLEADVAPREVEAP